MVKKELEDILGKILAKLVFKGIRKGKKILAFIVLILIFIILLFIGFLGLLLYLVIQVIDWVWDSILQLIRAQTLT